MVYIFQRYRVSFLYAIIGMMLEEYK